jgi:hypothetical protein
LRKPVCTGNSPCAETTSYAPSPSKSATPRSSVESSASVAVVVGVHVHEVVLVVVVAAVEHGVVERHGQRGRLGQQVLHAARPEDRPRVDEQPVDVRIAVEVGPLALVGAERRAVRGRDRGQVEREVRRAVVDVQLRDGRLAVDDDVEVEIAVHVEHLRVLRADLQHGREGGLGIDARAVVQQQAREAAGRVERVGPGVREHQVG